LVSSEQTPKKKGKQTVCNYDFLTSEYQQGMLAGLFLASNLSLNKKLKILHLGTGAGVMPMFLRTQLDECLESITTIDNNANMLKIAEKYFGFHPDEKLVSLCQDAYEYIENTKLPKDNLFDIAIMDINYTEEDLHISPPWKFLTTEFLQKIANEFLNQDCAYFCINVIYYSEEAKTKVHDCFKAVKNFHKLAVFEVDEGNNKVFVLSRNKLAVPQ